MFRKFGLSALVLAGLLMLTQPPKANAGVVGFGVGVVAPAYPYPAYGPYAYSSPYACDPYGYN